MKLSSLLALLSVTSASAFVAPRSFPTQAAPRTILSASPNDDQYQHRISRAATAAVATIAATLASSPLAALAAEEADGYEYGAVNAPGGIGECVLGVMVVARFDGYCDVARWVLRLLTFGGWRCCHFLSLAFFAVLILTSIEMLRFLQTLKIGVFLLARLGVGAWQD